MNTRILTVIGLLGMGIFTANASCSDGSSDDGGTAGASGSTGSAGSGGGTASGACQSTTDKEALGPVDNPTTYPGEGDAGPQTVSQIVRTCGIGCLSTDPPEPCVASCVAMQTMPNTISGGCTDCLIAAFQCGLEHCLMPCLGSEAECDACRCGGNAAGVNCVEADTECTGNPSDACNP